MNSIIRGLKNVLRSPLKTVGIVLILGLAMTVALIMLMANQVVEKRIKDVKGNLGNLVTVSPKGIFGFEGGGELLNESDLTPISSINHVSLVSLSLQARPTSTSLTSAIEPGSFGERFGSRRIEQALPGSRQEPTTVAFVSLSATGTNLVGSLPSSLGLGETTPTLTDGRYFTSEDAGAQVAIVGKDLATKNGLQIGSTFQLEEQTFTVVGIFDSGALFGNNALYLPLQTTQTIFDLAGKSSTATVTVDSLSNAEGVVNEIGTLLGDKADVSSELDRISAALSPLESISQTTRVAVIGAIVSGVVIIFFSMLITVRQRIKEIGILKAIGASNFHLVTQFVTETMAVSLSAAVLATGLSLAAGNAIVGGLVQQSAEVGRNGFAQGVGRFFFGDIESLQIFNLDVLVYALLIAIGVGILGSIIPALIASRLKPAEVIRLE